MRSCNVGTRTASPLNPDGTIHQIVPRLQVGAQQRRKLSFGGIAGTVLSTTHRGPLKTTSVGEDLLQHLAGQRLAARGRAQFLCGPYGGKESLDFLLEVTALLGQRLCRR